MLATLIGSLTEAGIPALLKPLLDRGFTQGSLQLWAVPAAVLTLFVLRGVAGFAAQYALSRIANDGMVKLRQDMFARLLNAELGLFSRQSASTLSNTVVFEVQSGATMLVQALLGLSRDTFTLIALVGYLLYKKALRDLVILGAILGMWWASGTPYMQTLVVDGELQINKVLPVLFGGAAVLGLVIYLLIGRSD